MADAALKSYASDDLSAEQLTKMVMRLFELWKLTYPEQAGLLGLSSKTRSTIARYKNGSSYIVFDRDVYDRVGFLLAIHKNLRTIFPLNEELAYAWPKTRNRAFEGKSPVEIMIEEGFLGVVRVHRYLDHYMAS